MLLNGCSNWHHETRTQLVGDFGTNESNSPPSGSHSPVCWLESERGFDEVTFPAFHSPDFCSLREKNSFKVAGFSAPAWIQNVSMCDGRPPSSRKIAISWLMDREALPVAPGFHRIGNGLVYSQRGGLAEDPVGQHRHDNARCPTTCPANKPSRTIQTSLESFHFIKRGPK